MFSENISKYFSKIQHNTVPKIKYGETYMYSQTVWGPTDSVLVDHKEYAAMLFIVRLIGYTTSYEIKERALGRPSEFVCSHILS